MVAQYICDLCSKWWLGIFVMCVVDGGLAYL